MRSSGDSHFFRESLFPRHHYNHCRMQISTIDIQPGLEVGNKRCRYGYKNQCQWRIQEFTVGGTILASAKREPFSPPHSLSGGPGVSPPENF